MLKSRRFWSTLLGIVLITGALGYTLYPRVSVKTDRGIVSISFAPQAAQAATTKQITAVSGKGTAKLETTGCTVYKGKIQLRFDCFLDPSAPGYDIHYVYVVDETSPEFLAGYSGEVDKDGFPVNQADYDKWLASLPHKWQNNPFVCIFIHIDDKMTDTQILETILSALAKSYDCWRVRFDMRGIKLSETQLAKQTLTSAQLQTYQARLNDIVSRASEFQVMPIGETK